MKDYAEEQAIKDCKHLWSRIEASNSNKQDYLMNHPASKFYNYYCTCPLCEWTSDDEYEFHLEFTNCPDTVRVCPLIKQYGKDCFQLGYSSHFTNPFWLDKIKNLKLIKEEN